MSADSERLRGIARIPTMDLPPSLRWSTGEPDPPFAETRRMIIADGGCLAVDATILPKTLAAASS